MTLDGGWAFASAAQLPGGALEGDDPPAARPGFADPALTTVLVPDSFGAVRARWNDDNGLVGVYRRTLDVPRGGNGERTALSRLEEIWARAMKVVVAHHVLNPGKLGLDPE